MQPNKNFWRCNCQIHPIHSRLLEQCSYCNAKKEKQPNITQKEAEAWIKELEHKIIDMAGTAGETTNINFWDCDCPLIEERIHQDVSEFEGYIHPKEHNWCPVCGNEEEDRPDATQEELEMWLKNLKDMLLPQTT